MRKENRPRGSSGPLSQIRKDFWLIRTHLFIRTPVRTVYFGREEKQDLTSNAQVGYAGRFNRINSEGDTPVSFLNDS